MSSHREYNPYNHMCMKEDVVFDEKEMVFLCVDMDKSEIPKGSIRGSSAWTKDLFNLVVFTHNLFMAKGLSSKLFLIQKEQPIPGGDFVRCSNIDGYFLVGAFSETDMKAHFSTACRAAIVLNNGLKSYDIVMDEEVSLEQLAGYFTHLNAYMGLMSKETRKKPKVTVGSFLNVRMLDESIASYHNFFTENEDGRHANLHVEIDRQKADEEETWQERMRLLTWRYLLEHSSRQKKMYLSLLSLGKLMTQTGTGVNRTDFCKKADLEILVRMKNAITPDHPLKEVFSRHVEWLQWDMIVKHENSSTHLDLKNRIAWDITSMTGDFNKEQFYAIYTDEALLKRVAKQNNMDDEMLKTEVGKGLLQQYVSRLSKESMQAGNDLKERKEAETVYPVIERLRDEIFSIFADVLGQKDHVCRLYQDPIYSAFFMEKYKSDMSESPNQSETRKLQNAFIDTLISSDKFKEAYMNSLVDEDGHKRLLFHTVERDNVDPIQDVMANHFLRIASISGVRQMSVELIMFLCANILSFSNKQNKPYIVLDGPPGCGKSNVAAIAKMIMTWQNDLACQTEEYATTRSHTVSYEKRYQCVMGTKFINEWTTDKNMMDNTSVESTVPKQLFDDGKCKSQRAMKSKKKDKDDEQETFFKSIEVNLDDRTWMICANGFKAASSFRDRCIEIQVPALKKKSKFTSRTEMQKLQVLRGAAIPEQFTVIRYLISEQMNRDAVNLSLRSRDAEDRSHSVECEMTMERIVQVLDKMGFSEHLLTDRKQEQIHAFARVLAHYRAVVEVYGCLPKLPNLQIPSEDQTVSDYNDYLVGLAENHLAMMTQHKRDLMLAERVVVDPSDVLTASTLLLQLTQPETQLINAIALYMTWPNKPEQYNNETYFVMENVTLKRMAQDLKIHGHGVVEETLDSKMVLVEDTTSMHNSVPSIFRWYESGGLNKNRPREQQQFKLYVHAPFAAKVFVKEEKKLIRECEEVVFQYMKKVASGEEKPNAFPHANEIPPGRGCLLKYPKHISVPIPSHLKRAFDFLSLLPEKEVFGTSHGGAGQDMAIAVVHPDFGRSRSRAIQSILTETYATALFEGRCPPSFGDERNGIYMKPNIKHPLFFQATYSCGVPSPKQEPVPLVILKEYGLQLHVGVFSNKFDREEGIDYIRSQIVERYLLHGQFAEEDYFSIDDKCDLFKTIVDKESLLNADLTCEMPCIAPFTNTFMVSYAFLNKVEVEEQEEKSITRQFIENCLCENMTDFKSIMYFDRERLYDTQREEDAISFVTISDVVKNLPDNQLPKWSCNPPESITDRSSMDIYSKIIERPTTLNTFLPGHRKRKLALNNLFANNHINILINEIERDFDDIEDRKVHFTMKLDDLVKRAADYNWSGSYTPLVGNRTGLAREVYSQSHPLTKRLYRKRKYQVEDAGTSVKRICSV